MDKSLSELGNLLRRQGWTFVGVDRAHGLARGTAWRTHHYPHKAGEAAIAAAIGCDPANIWPSRHDSNGQRLSPQPRHYYTRPTEAEKRSARRAS